MTRKERNAPVSAAAGLRVLRALSLVVLLAGCGAPRPRGNAVAEDRAPVIAPDLAGTVVPPNIAPVPFRVCEEASAYFVSLETGTGQPLEARSTDGRIMLPPRAWRELLADAKGRTVRVTVWAYRKASGWHRFEPVTFDVATDPIDEYLVYRRITPQYSLWYDVGVFQRHLPTYAEEPVLQGLRFQNGCTNCHAFPAGNPATMSIATRSESFRSACLLVRGDRMQTLDTKWNYTNWHPSGRYAAYSLNHVVQFFHAMGDEVRDVVDLDSEIVIYDAETGDVFTAASLTDPQRMETYPAWSADGKTLFFCSAPITWEDRRGALPECYAEIRYDLRKVSFDPATRALGEAETVLEAAAVGKSILLPRASPDGRLLVCCLCAYGCFPIYQPSSDLYALDLEDGSLRELTVVNSPLSESYHSWSSNGRWLAFSSKRDDGIWTRTYLAHCDEQGNFGKPFRLPQRDPGFYDGYLKTYTVPELATAPVRVSARALARAARTPQRVRVELPETTMSPKSGDAQSTVPWRAGDKGSRR
ncbi:MAG: PD40 domain-containing protein [Lentisphaeria bacterium]|nr:PD40 domain-containing protein [Lentisphaeria bacterium]